MLSCLSIVQASTVPESIKAKCTTGSRVMHWTLERLWSYLWKHLWPPISPLMKTTLSKHALGSLRSSINRRRKCSVVWAQFWQAQVSASTKPESMLHDKKVSKHALNLRTAVKPFAILNTLKHRGSEAWRSCIRQCRTSTSGSTAVGARVVLNCYFHLLVRKRAWEMLFPGSALVLKWTQVTHLSITKSMVVIMAIINIAFAEVIQYNWIVHNSTFRCV